MLMLEQPADQLSPVIKLLPTYCEATASVPGSVRLRRRRKFSNPFPLFVFLSFFSLLIPLHLVCQPHDL
ncbi:hypothetical protein LY76DRAFT_304749 [Colletotrichum caudatum]|nr:hypothetical protein LY76DRAFT_304749 [Colletotrichum caudatum]